SFVGRDLELVEVARLLADPETRLVTLTGPGGVGKSSLAWAAARQELRTGTYPGGVFLASLESAPDGAVASTLAAAMGLNGVETVDELAAAIGAGRTLLVLDGCERLVGALGAVTELLAACEGLKVLATSRERLGLPGEQLFPVDGLPLPAEGEDPMRTRYLDSVRLFEQRAKRVDLGFTLDAGSLPHVAAVCRTVAGSPLGIELAAALVRLLPPAELAAELARGVRPLLGTPRTPGASGARCAGDVRRRLHARGGGAGRRRVTARAGRPRRQVAGERHAWGAVRDPPPGEAVRAGRAGERPGARDTGAPPARHVPARGLRRSAGRGGRGGRAPGPPRRRARERPRRPGAGARVGRRRRGPDAGGSGLVRMA